MRAGPRTPAVAARPTSRPVAERPFRKGLLVRRCCRRRAWGSAVHRLVMRPRAKGFGVRPAVGPVAERLILRPRPQWLGESTPGRPPAEWPFGRQVRTAITG